MFPVGVTPMQVTVVLLTGEVGSHAAFACSLTANEATNSASTICMSPYPITRA